MNMIFLCQLTVYLFLCVNIIKGEGVHYTPDWKSLDSRPLPSWYDNAKIGIFIHWGVYSVPSYDSEWFWLNWHLNVSDIVKFMKKNYRPGFTYQNFASDFTAELFDPFKWAKLFEASGAEYVILTSKHHEGYALWPSKYSYSWNSVDVGPHRDLIGELAGAIRNKTKLHFGLYHSLLEWFHPLYLNDKNNNFTTQQFVTDKIIPELKELVYQYRPEIIWSDGEWEAPDSYWKSKEFLAWLYNESPVKKSVVVNDRWGSNTLCKHGGYMTCSDRYNPGILQKKKWENAFTIDSRSWGFRRNADIKEFLTSAEMIALLAQAVSCNGNIAMNIGPAKDGMISPIYQERLTDMGKWLKVNGPAIYGSRPWIVCQNDTQTPAVWYTTKKTPERKVDLYAIVLNWPTKDKLLLGCPQMTEATKVTMLGVHQELKWVNDSNNTVLIEFPGRSVVRTDWAWVLKITGVLNIMRLEQNN